MNCQKCGHQAKYMQRAIDRGTTLVDKNGFKMNRRTNFTVKCNYCGFIGDPK